MTMLESAISDQKRAARGLYWKRVQYLLRARDKVHHRSWRLLTIAGPVPHEEIGCIRALMPRAHIVSVDTDAANLEAAIDAGADEVFQMDVGAFQQIPTGSRYGPEFRFRLPIEFENQERFDVVSLDLTGPADDWLRRCVYQYFCAGGVTAGGALTVTFSYGRDVVEMYGIEWERINGKQLYEGSFDPVGFLDPIPSPVVERVWYLCRYLVKHLDSCIQYRGHSMPMVSCLLRKGTPPSEPSFISLEPIDHELLVAAEDTGAVFACPAERVQELRAQYSRRIAARKAVETRRLRENKQPPQLRLVDGSPKLPAITDGTQASTGSWQHGSHIDSMPTQQPQTLAELQRLWDLASGDERAEFWKYLHREYIESRRLGPDVAARTALISEINQQKSNT